ncbi:MAG: hypothetical protein HY722_00690 [Planctomycetes bacterium]|nr:hypothetical protein [Planctomycetota bacterium]
MNVDLFSGVFAYLAFVIVCLTGALRGMPLADVLTRAILALIVFAVLGRVFGALGRRLVLESISQEKEEQPIPTLAPAPTGARRSPGA